MITKYTFLVYLQIILKFKIDHNTCYVILHHMHCIALYYNLIGATPHLIHAISHFYITFIIQAKIT